MILGVGLDVVDVAAFREQLELPGTAFGRAFTARERREAAGVNVAERLAARWGAKEAFIKAWSAALKGRPPVLGEVAWHEIEVVTDAWHRPGLALHADVAEAFANSVGQARIHVSLSHDGPVAQAIVVLESEAADDGAAGAGPGMKRIIPD